MNKIKLRVIDGYPDTTTYEGTWMKTYFPKIFGQKVLEKETDKILYIGDYVVIENYKSKIIDRMYFSDDDIFYYFCQDFWTGRKE